MPRYIWQTVLQKSASDLAKPSGGFATQTGVPKNFCYGVDVFCRALNWLPGFYVKVDSRILLAGFTIENNGKQEDAVLLPTIETVENNKKTEK